MADYNSAGSGDWVGDAASVWDAGDGSYPGDTGAQADDVDVLNGHTIDIDMATLDGTVTITIEDGGTLRVSAEMTDEDCFTALTIAADGGNGGGLLTFEAGGDRTIIVGGPVSVSGAITQDCSGGSDVYTIKVHGDYALTVNDGGVYTIKGASGMTDVTLLDGAITADGANAVDFDVDDDTGWAIGDEIVFADDYDVVEAVTLVAGSLTTYAAVLGDNHSGGTLDADYARFSEALLDINDADTEFDFCVFRNCIVNADGVKLYGGICDCITYMDHADYEYSAPISWQPRPLNELRLVRYYQLSAKARFGLTVSAARPAKVFLDSCEFLVNSGLGTVCGGG